MLASLFFLQLNLLLLSKVLSSQCQNCKLMRLLLVSLGCAFSWGNCYGQQQSDILSLKCEKWEVMRRPWACAEFKLLVDGGLGPVSCVLPVSLDLNYAIIIF